MFITDNVYAVEASKGAYAYALRQGEGVTLIDTSTVGRGESIEAELRARGLGEVKRILLTHHDVDHIGNAALLQQKYRCEVYISATDMPYVQGVKKREGIKRLFSSLFKVALPEHLQALPQDDIAGIQIIPSPGHTPGHTCFLFEKVLFAGDLLNSRNGVLHRFYPLMTWDMPQALASAHAMNSLDFAWVCPVHGEPVKTSRIEIV